MTLIEVLTVIVLIFVSILIIFIIIYLGKITRSIQFLQKDVGDLSDKVEPLVTSLSDLTNRFSALSESAHKQLDVTKGIIYSAKDEFDKIIQLERKIRTGIDGPVSQILNQIKAISNGVSTFLSYLKK